MPFRLGKLGMMVRLALLPAAAFSGGTAHAAGPAKAGDGDALAACDVRMEQAEAVVPGTGEPLFLSADGTRYFASDVRFPGRGGEHMAPVSRNDLSADSDFAAVPAGPPNRWGLVPAWIVLREAGGSHLWQARQLEAGHALFAPDRATADCADALRRAEGRRGARMRASLGENVPDRSIPRPGQGLSKRRLGAMSLFVGVLFLLEKPPVPVISISENTGKRM